MTKCTMGFSHNSSWEVYRSKNIFKKVMGALVYPIKGFFCVRKNRKSLLPNGNFDAIVHVDELE